MVSNSTPTLSTTGLMADVTTVLGVVKDVATVAEAAAPGFKALLEVIMSTFSISDQATITEAYQAKIAQTDSDHEATQAALTKRAAEVPGSGKAEASPKGGGL